jgi:hypothetical protein
MYQTSGWRILRAGWVGTGHDGHYKDCCQDRHARLHRITSEIRGLKSVVANLRQDIDGSSTMPRPSRSRPQVRLKCRSIALNSASSLPPSASQRAISNVFALLRKAVGKLIALHRTPQASSQA